MNDEDAATDLGRRVINMLKITDMQPSVALVAIENVLLSGYVAVMKYDSYQMKKRFGEMVDAWMEEN